MHVDRDIALGTGTIFLDIHLLGVVDSLKIKFLPPFNKIKSNTTAVSRDIFSSHKAKR